MMRRFAIALAVLLGLSMGANGIFMLADPADWYFAVPGVTSTGPFNQHFLRDIGLIFVMIGAAYVLGAARPANRVLLWTAPSLWLSGHALFHLWEVAVGICSPAAIPRDFAAVTLPAVIGLGLSVWAARDRRGSRPG
jgi:hypothetical protein